MKNYWVLVLLGLCLFGACKKNSEPSPQIFSFSPEKGAAGNLVWITGVHFDSVVDHITVYFNGQPATVYMANDSSIEVFVPSGATTGKITVKVNGLSVTSQDAFMILPGQWIQKTGISSVPAVSQGNGGTGRGLGIGFAIGNKGYMGMGTDNGSDFDDLYEYDPNTDSWTTKTSMGLGMEDPVCMVINDKAYVGIGYSRQLLTNTLEFFEYDPASDTWTRKADFPGVKRRDAIGIGIGNKGYVGLGDDSVENSKNDWWEYDPAIDAWTRKADFPDGVPDWHAAGFALNDKIYVEGVSSANSNVLNWWEYDTATDKWTQKKDYPGMSTTFPCSIVINGKGYVMGGGFENWCYDPSSDLWTQVAFFGQRVGGSAFAIGSQGYFGLGNGFPGYLHNDLWQFTPQ